MVLFMILMVVWSLISLRRDRATRRPDFSNAARDVSSISLAPGAQTTKENLNQSERLLLLVSGSTVVERGALLEVGKSASSGPPRLCHVDESVRSDVKC